MVLLDWYGLYGELVELEASGNFDRSSGYIVAEIWLTVLWSGDRTGGRDLVLPDEESMVVNPRVFFRSSHDTFCNLTSVDLEAGRIHPLELGYNVTVSIRFSYNGSSVVYNVWTRASPDDYEPEDVSMSIADATAFWEEVAVVCTGFGAVAGLVAIKVRSKT